MHEEQVLRMALACIRWNQFGECRTDGWPGLPPTAADTVAALEASLAKPQPVGGALTDDQWLELAERHAVRDWEDAKRDGYLNSVKALCLDFATLSAPAAQPGEAEPMGLDGDCIAGIVSQRVRSVATPIAAQPAEPEPLDRFGCVVRPDPRKMGKPAQAAPDTSAYDLCTALRLADLQKVAQAAAVPEAVTEFNVGRYCLSEDDCRDEGINFAGYERGIADAAAAFARNAK